MTSASEPSLWHYVKAAFFARKPVPFLGGIPVNLLFLLGMGVAGLAFPGLWALAGAIELTYLSLRSHSSRFRALVRGQQLLALQKTFEERLEQVVATLAPDAQARFRKLSAKCDGVRSAEPSLSGLSGSTAGELHAGGLASLEMLYARLLQSRQGLLSYLREASQADLERRLDDTRAKLGAAPSEAIKRPLEANVGLLEKRIEQLKGARENLGVIDAELERLENQVDLLREEAAVSRDPAVLSARIDAVAKTIGEASHYLKASEAMMGDLEPESSLPASAPTRSASRIGSRES